MSLATIRSYLAHYFLGLAASCFNAGSRAVKLSGGITTAHALMPGAVPLPDVATLLTIFGSAMFWEAIDYFTDRPLPVVALPSARTEHPTP